MGICSGRTARGSWGYSLQAAARAVAQGGRLWPMGKNVLGAALLLLPVALGTSCDRVGDSARTAPVGRYQMLSVQNRTLKLDTSTGQTWFLDTDSAWKPLRV